MTRLTLVNLTGCVSFRTGIVSRAKNSLGKTIKKACIGYFIGWHEQSLLYWWS